MHILSARDFIVQPWKNGAGVTTEIAVAPPGATLEDFDWRLSMARVAAAGPFSMFGGIDRSLGLLEGAGLVLHATGRGAVDLRPGAHPAVFPGDEPVTATLVGGPILDLNLMSRRGRWRHLLSRVAVEPGVFDLRRRGDVTVALVRGAGGRAAGQLFADGDALVASADDGDGAIALTLDGPCVVWIADLWRLSPA